MKEENESEPLNDVMESDQAIEPDVKVAVELGLLTENGDDSEEEEMVTAYATAKMPLLDYIISEKQTRRQNENTTLVDISKQMAKQTKIERISSVLLSFQKYTKLLATHQAKLIDNIVFVRVRCLNHV